MTDSKQHYQVLDALRGVAAIIVVCYHIFEGFSFAQITNQAGDGLIRIFNHGYLAVDFFFLLSGFVINYAYNDRWDKLTTRKFFSRRLIRLHPMLIGSIHRISMLFNRRFTTMERNTNTSLPFNHHIPSYLFYDSCFAKFFQRNKRQWRAFSTQWSYVVTIF